MQKKFFGLGEWRNGVGNLVYTFDHLGSLREMTQAEGALNGTVRARYEYDPYGRRSANLITGGNALAADWGFTGHYYHAPSGLHLAWFRAYDANLGRWIWRDPIQERGGLNLYGYGLNDPVNLIDPHGLEVGEIPVDAGFTRADIFWAIYAAESIGLTGPDGIGLKQMFKEMEDSKQKLTFLSTKEGSIPNTSSGKASMSGGPTDVILAFPKCDPNSKKADINSHGGKKYYFDPAILHELIHAYQGMTGTNSEISGEREKAPNAASEPLNVQIDLYLKDKTPSPPGPTTPAK